MTRASKINAARLTVEALLVLVVAIFLVVRFEERIASVNWGLVTLLCGLVFVVFCIYRLQIRADNEYNVLQMVTTRDGRADLAAHLIIVFACLSIWVVVQQALSKQPVTEMLLGILAIFVGGKAVGGFSDAMKSRGPPIDLSRGDVNIMPGATVQPPAAPAGPKLGV